MKINVTPIQDIKAGDKILSTADGKIWEANALLQENHHCYVLVLMRDERGVRLYDNHLLGKYALVDVVEQ